MSRRLAPLALVLASLAAPVRAQDPQVEQRAARDQRAREQTSAAASEAALLALADDEREVTYADVLDAPDDIVLNFRFAKTQVRRGNLKGASTTLERILLVQPELPRVRLFYAVVLYRLGDLHEAEREFQAVAALPLADPLRGEIEGYLTRIARERRLHRYSASLALGTQVDTNRNASPSARSVLFQDQVIPLADTSLRDSDVSYVSVLGLGAERDLATQEGDKLTASFSYYGSEQRDLGDFDLQAMTLDGGARLVTDYGTFTPQIFGTQVALAHEKYIESGGLELRLDYQASSRLALFAHTRFEYQDFKPVASSPTADDRSGGTLQLDLGGDWSLGPSQRLALQLGLTDKEARVDYHAYAGVAGLVSHTWLLGRGQFLLTNASAQHDRYQDAQDFVSHLRRRDTIVRGQLAYGVPLDLLFSRWVELRALQGVVVTLRLEHQRSISTLRNYEYDNTTYGLSFTSNLDL